MSIDHVSAIVIALYAIDMFCNIKRAGGERKTMGTNIFSTYIREWKNSIFLSLYNDRKADTSKQTRAMLVDVFVDIGDELFELDPECATYKGCKSFITIQPDSVVIETPASPSFQPVDVTDIARESDSPVIIGRDEDWSY